MEVEVARCTLYSTRNIRVELVKRDRWYLRYVASRYERILFAKKAFLFRGAFTQDMIRLWQLGVLGIVILIDDSEDILRYELTKNGVRMASGKVVYQKAQTFTSEADIPLMLL